MSDAAIPVCAVKLTPAGGVALEVPLGPTPKDQGLSPFRGWGMVPLIANPEETEPESEEIRKEMTRFLRLSKGHTNLAKVWLWQGTAILHQGRRPILKLYLKLRNGLHRKGRRQFQT